MPRTYKPRPKQDKLCACGCNQPFKGRANQKYLSPYHKLKAFRKKMKNG